MTSTAERPIAIISAPGSRGDVNPMVAIGRELRKRGFDVVISLAENYAPVAEQAGLVAEPLISREAFDAMVDNPAMWRPFQGIRIIFRDASSKFLEPHLQVIKKHHRPNRTILIAHPLDFASRIYRDLDPSTPMVSVHLSPAAVRDPLNPPRLTASRLFVRRPPWLVQSVYWLADVLIADRLIGPSINRVRKQYGLKPVSRILDRWWLSPDLVIGMYPNWFGDSKPPCDSDWKACGFPLLFQDSQATFDESTFADRPVFATPGTAHHHAKAFFNNLVEASRLLGRKCILATSYPDQLPTSLASHVFASAYVPLPQVLPRCSAIVHHGGIGTTAMSCATACPQLICPMAYDQFHNADQIEKLGLGYALRSNPWTSNPQAVNELADRLDFLIRDEQTQANCRKFAEKKNCFQGSEMAAESIASLLDRFPGNVIAH
jgi:rhamnosyltransferase subunit B